MTAGLELAYLGFEVSDLPGWEALLTNVIGLTGNGDNADGSRGYRMDECEQRLFLRPGSQDDVAAVGLAALNRGEFDAALGRLKAAGVAVDTGDESACRARHVTEQVSFRDPSGNPLELCLGQRVAATAFASAVMPGGFVTGDRGMGHIVLVTQDRQPTLRFYTDVIGMAVSDRGAEEWAGLTIEAVFLHCNRRHHSIALGAGIPPVKRTAHFEMHVPDIDAVGLACDRARRAGVEITHLPGRHTDDVFSFYGRTPSGFEWEIGTGGYDVGPNWRQRHLTRFTAWGHQPPAS
jgi:biphenyl-2,3-diol 1,2-dioxygenase